MWGSRHPRSTTTDTRLESIAAAPLIAAVLALILVLPCRAQSWRFTDVTAASGLVSTHAYADPTQVREAELTAAGAAIGDYDGDGWLDVYTVSGSAGANLLFHNRGDGTFEERGQAAGVAISGAAGAGPIFADIDGDGWPDLMVLGVGGSQLVLLRNLGNGSFEDVSGRSGIAVDRDSYSAAFADYDRDGDLDVAISHWSTYGAAGSTQHLWRNDGAWRFTDVSLTAGLSRWYFDSGGVVFQDFSFTPNFADLDNDGWPDLLLSGDFSTSKVFRNRRDGSFDNITEPVISDENGMGVAVGDYDGDGNLDWFVSSIFDPNGVVEEGGYWSVSGNRLYRNLGGGRFEDTTDRAGVRDGGWGWGSTFADLNNDGHLDLVQVNGWGPLNNNTTSEYHADAARCFVSNRDATFSERAAELGVADTGQGRGVAAFDYDRDGDLDLFIANNQQPGRLLRNDGGNASHWLQVSLRGASANSAAVGARIYLSAGGRSQMRELRAGSNFESQDPIEADFGLGAVQVIDELRIVWPPDGSQTRLLQLPTDRAYVIRQLAGAVCTGDCDADGAVSFGELQQLVHSLFDPSGVCGLPLRASAAALPTAVRRFAIGCVASITDTTPSGRVHPD